MNKQKTSWEDELRHVPSFSKLDRNLTTDIVIVGGGITGILVAYTLARSGKKVVVLESKRLLSNATVRTTAFLTHILDTDLGELIDMFGKGAARLIWQSHKKAIDEIEKIIVQEDIKCEFKRCSNYIIANSQNEAEDLHTELRAIKQIGLKASFGQKNLGIKHSGYLEIKEQAKFHPVKFLEEIIKLAESRGVQFFENTEVNEITGTSKVRAKTKKFVVTADYAITATYDPLNNPKETFAKKGMYKSYVFEVEIPHGKIPEALYEDMQNPYHYFRIDKGNKHDRMIIGGEDNRMEIAVADRKNFVALRNYLKELLGKNKYKITVQWTGPILEPSDGLALIGQFRPRQFIATAFSGNGMTYAMISAILICDLILKKSNPWKKLYDPKRKLKLKRLLKKGLDYTEEFFGGVAKNILK